MNENFMNETTMEENNYTPAEVTEDPSSEDDSSALAKVALGVGVAAVTGAVLLYRATKDKRAAKKQAKAGFTVTAPEDTVDTEAKVVEAEVTETETDEEETE